jgi:DNA-binding transcriptional MerR regulator
MSNRDRGHRRETGVTGWRIDELARQSGVGVDTIRFYQREGLLPAGEREGRTMQYGPRHLERLARIRALQARRFSLAAIHAILEHDGPSIEALLAGRDGRSYEHEELVAAAGVPVEFVRALEKVGLLGDPDEFGRAAYDCDDVEVVRSFGELRTLGVPDDVLVELARILTDGIEAVTRQTAALFHGDAGPHWPAEEHARFVAHLRDASPGIARGLRSVADYLHHRNTQRLVLRTLEQQHGAANPRRAGSETG